MVALWVGAKASCLAGKMAENSAAYLGGPMGFLMADQKGYWSADSTAASMVHQTAASMVGSSVSCLVASLVDATVGLLGELMVQESVVMKGDQMAARLAGWTA